MQANAMNKWGIRGGYMAGRSLLQRAPTGSCRSDCNLERTNVQPFVMSRLRVGYAFAFKWLIVGTPNGSIYGVN
jgi:hypothetical protein